MLRRIFNILIVLPLAILFVVFAVANRQTVTLSFNPFDSGDAALGVSLPLFVVIIVAAILGVVAGGIATWFGQHRWRRAARHLEAEARQVRAELADLRERARSAARGGPAGSEGRVPAAALSSSLPAYSAIGRDKPGAAL